MKPKIEYRRFAGVEGSFVEMADFEARWPDRKPERTWTCHCVFIPDADPAAFRGRFPEVWHIDAIPNVRPMGTWLMGGHYWLEKALELLDEPTAAR